MLEELRAEPRKETSRISGPGSRRTSGSENRAGQGRQTAGRLRNEPRAVSKDALDTADNAEALAKPISKWQKNNAI